MKAVVCVAILFNVGVVAAQQVELSVVPNGDVTNARLDWQAIPNETYSVEGSDRLQPPSWTNLTGDGVLSSNVLGAYETAISNQVQFFRVVKHDTSPPAIVRLVPEDDAIAVPSNTTVSLTLSDETGIDTNSFVLSIASWTNMTMAEGMLSWSNGTVSFVPPSSLGNPGSVVTGLITVADTLGYTLSNSMWSFQIDRTNVATDAFIPLTAPPASQGLTILSDGKTERIRSLPSVRPLGGTDEYHIFEVTSNTVVFSYDTAPPDITNGTLMVSFDAAYPFYRSVVSNNVDSGRSEVTAWTTNIPLTALVQETSVSVVDFTPAQPSGDPQALVAGSLALLHVEFGDDLSGTVLHEDAGLKLHLQEASWAFVGDVDVAFDIVRGELRALDASAGGSLALNMTPEVIFYQAISGGGSVPLITPATRIFGGMAGPIPVWVEVSMELNAGYSYDASGSGNAHTTIDAEQELTFRLRLRDNTWTAGTDNPPIVLEADPIIWQLEGTANAKIYVQPKLTVLVYSLAGPCIDIKPYAEIDGWYQESPLEYELGLYFGLSSTLGIESRIWYVGWGSKPEWVLFDQKWPLWSDAHPDARGGPRFVSPFPGRTVQAGARLVLDAYAQGSPPPMYKWYFKGTRIVGATSPEYLIDPAVAGHAGEYRVQAWNNQGAVETCAVVIVQQPAPSGMVLIPGGANGGTNPLGEGESYDASYYPSNYSLTVTSFYMDRTEVTKAQWDEVASWADDNGYDIGPGDASGKATNHPVQAVTWYECVKWCNARSEKEGKTWAYYTSATTTAANVYRAGVVDVQGDWVRVDTGYRLPTCVEWQYAARGGVANRRFPWGSDSISHSQANYHASDYAYDLSSGGYHPSYIAGGRPYTSPVGAFEMGKNAYGVYDMAGNVWEWCYDWYPGYEGTFRVKCGGSWAYGADYCRVAYRNGDLPGGSHDDKGFRAVLPTGEFAP